MGNEYIIELTPPTTEEVRNARPLATVPPHDVLTHAMLTAVTLWRVQKMIALCRKGRCTIASCIWQVQLCYRSNHRLPYVIRDAKVSSTVLRGRGDRKVAWLLDKPPHRIVGGMLRTRGVPETQSCVDCCRHPSRRPAGRWAAKLYMQALQTLSAWTAFLESPLASCWEAQSSDG
jgi:hypothetical protein